MSHNVAIKVLEETIPFIITVETENGKNYRGKLKSIQENMNCHLEDVSLVNSNGIILKYRTVFLRGTACKIFILPDFMKETPVIKIIFNQKN
jgi:small nuclear ribonucleoprotein D3